MKRWWLFLLPAMAWLGSAAQHRSALPADKWVDSVFKTLSQDEKIAQLMVIRMSSMKNGVPVFFDEQVMEAVRKYNIGGICLFQGGPVQQAQRINALQASAKTPVLVTVDAEWGLGMRFDSVRALPRQMMLGAVPDPGLVYDYGKLVAAQCKRMGIQLNFAPVVDVNNNPLNPVINDRSFGEDKFKVADWGTQYMLGMQDNGVMACAKHFPGHGDVTVDSHYDLPVINKRRAALDSLELFPFRKLFQSGVASVMVAHLSIPSIDRSPNRPSSLSKKAVAKLLIKDLGYQGLSITDALDMQGVAKYFPAGEASVQALMAGNDLLCLPGDIPGSIEKVKYAIQKKKLNWDDIDKKVRKLLYAKYRYGLANWHPVDYSNLVEDLNKGIRNLRRSIAEQSITVLRNDNSLFPHPAGATRRVAYVGLGLSRDNLFAERMRKDYGAHVYYFDYSMDTVQANALLALMRGRYDLVITGFHNYNRKPSANFGISKAALYLGAQLEAQQNQLTLFFGNPYAAANLCGNKTLLTTYEDDPIIQETTADLLEGKFHATGKLPVSICAAYPYGSGITENRLLPDAWAGELGFDYSRLQKIDSVCENAITERAIPGCAVLVAKDGKIVYERAFGQYAYTDTTPVYRETIYDLASVTKVMATTLSVMKLYDEGRLDLTKTLGDYLPWTRESNKGSLVIKDVLLHQAGLKSFIPFYKATIDSLKGIPYGNIYAYSKDSLHSVRVAEELYMRKDWIDTMYSSILRSELGPGGKYLYSDNDFIFLGKIVEAITGRTLDRYAFENFYQPLGLVHTGFLPRLHFPKDFMAPTEQETIFRRQLIQGDVHDPGAAMFGGVAGHAGLFSDVYDLAVLSQMLINKGEIKGIRFFKPSTVDLFTAYNSEGSRRGLGFDKPEKDNASRTEPYPAASVSPATFGHTGFTGTCVWVDPIRKLTFVFLSNRVNNNGDPTKFLKMNVRPVVHEIIYSALRKP